MVHYYVMHTDEKQSAKLKFIFYLRFVQLQVAEVNT